MGLMRSREARHNTDAWDGLKPFFLRAFFLFRQSNPRTDALRLQAKLPIATQV